MPTLLLSGLTSSVRGGAEGCCTVGYRGGALGLLLVLAAARCSDSTCPGTLEDVLAVGCCRLQACELKRIVTENLAALQSA